MLVAIVTDPTRPAWAMISASWSWKRAFSTLCGICALLQHLGEGLGLLDRDRADQGRLALAVRRHDLVGDRRHLLAGGAVDLVVLVFPDHVAVGRDLDHLELVDLAELGSLGRRRAGHAGELRVEAEVVLEGDRRQRLVLGLDLHAFLGFQRLVQPVRVAPAVHHPACELVDDDDLAVLDDVVDVAAEQLVRAQALVDVVDEGDVVDVVEVGRLQEARCLQHGLGVLLALLGHGHRALLLVLLPVLGHQLAHELVDGAVELGAVLGGT